MDCEKCSYYNKALARCRNTSYSTGKVYCEYKDLNRTAGEFCSNCRAFLEMSGRPGSQTTCLRYNYERLTWVIDENKIKYQKCKQCLEEMQQ